MTWLHNFPPESILRRHIVANTKYASVSEGSDSSLSQSRHQLCPRVRGSAFRKKKNFTVGWKKTQRKNATLNVLKDCCYVNQLAGAPTTTKILTKKIGLSTINGIITTCNHYENWLCITYNMPGFCVHFSFQNLMFA